MMWGQSYIFQVFFPQDFKICATMQWQYNPTNYYASFEQYKSSLNSTKEKKSNLHLVS